MPAAEFLNLVNAWAVIAGGAGVAYWLLRGAFVPSLRLTLDVARDKVRTKAKEDILNATLLLENSGRVSIALEHVRLRVITGISGHEAERRISLMRCEFTGENDVHDSWNPSGARPINLAPSDSTHVGSIFIICANDPCIVEAVVIASDPLLRKVAFMFGRTGLQWRASRAVAPIKNDEQSDEREPT